MPSDNIIVFDFDALIWRRKLTSLAGFTMIYWWFRRLYSGLYTFIGQPCINNYMGYSERPVQRGDRARKHVRVYTVAKKLAHFPYYYKFSSDSNSEY